MTKNLKITIGWLYPRLMSTYGDRGNIYAIQKRCEWRNINTELINIDTNCSTDDFKKLDLIFGGGAQDKEQQIVMKDLLGKKGKILKEYIENNLPALFVCGSPQLMGKFYEPSIGQKIEGLGIFDMETIHPGINKPRLIGNVAAEIIWKNLDPKFNYSKKIIIGFENHGGRSYLGKNALPLAKILKGYGNNGKDGHEGVVYKNAIGTYLHGPLLPKNPVITDIMIKKALKYKYKQDFELKPLNDELENIASKFMLKKMGIEVHSEK